MKIATPVNENYAATVVRIAETHKLPGLDNLVGASFFGTQAIVKKETEVGKLGVLFTAETQLSMDMAKENNLHRHGIYNKDQGQSGYLEDNRRVRAIRLKGNASSALLLDINSLAWTGIKVDELKEGDTFDTINGKEICNKYVRKQKATSLANKTVVAERSRVDKIYMPEHVDSLNYWRNARSIKGDAFITVTQKLHGTSIRIAHTVVNRELSIFERALKRLGVKVETKEYDHVYGSRKVIKDINNPRQEHYYSEDLWSETGKKLDSIIPKGFVLYGEIIGYVGDSPIQKNYTYNLPPTVHKLYIYRVTQVSPTGIQTDLSWDALKQFCRESGLNHVPELWRGRHRNFNVDDFVDKKFAELGYKNAVPLSADSPVDEGVVIRAERIIPIILKAKSPIFLDHETKMLDQEVDDIEEEQK